jgi:small-conductance mechanosensitive channel
MAEVNAGAPRRTLKARAVDRVARAVAGDRLDRLQQRLDELEAEVQECRQLNIRLAELTDLVEQLLLPMAARDEERISAAVEKYSRTI